MFVLSYLVLKNLDSSVHMRMSTAIQRLSKRRDSCSIWTRQEVEDGKGLMVYGPDTRAYFRAMGSTDE